tara:strand:+ start:1251 stop:1562 length:312 start_codon:yes stop_codon:yes gene_type:complete
MHFIVLSCLNYAVFGLASSLISKGDEILNFTAEQEATEDKIWNLIMENLGPNYEKEVCASTSSFFRTADGVECSVRKRNGALIAHCYSESDRMGNRRWTCELQ